MGITGTDEIQPPDAKLPEAAPRMHHPDRSADQAASATRGRGPEHVAWRSMTDEVMFEIREMTGQTYTNVYAGQADTADEPKPSRVATVVDDRPASPAGDERTLVAAAS